MRIKLILALVLFAVVTADDQIETSSKALLVCRTFNLHDDDVADGTMFARCFRFR